MFITLADYWGSGDCRQIKIEKREDGIFVIEEKRHPQGIRVEVRHEDNQLTLLIANESEKSPEKGWQERYIVFDHEKHQPPVSTAQMFKELTA